MKKIMTLIKRDLTDYRGALVITPIAIASFFVLFVLIAASFGQVNLDGKGGFNIDIGDKGAETFVIKKGEHSEVVLRKENGVMVVDNGQKVTPVKEALNRHDKTSVSNALVFGTSIISIIPWAVSLIVILFVLSSSLTEEKKDRSIMFWKSMPIGDFQTVGAKLISISVGGLGIAILAGIASQISILLILGTKIWIMGGGFLLGINVIPVLVNAWALVIIFSVSYLLFALPVYCWFLAVSSYVSRASFVAAILPIGLLPVIGKLFFPAEMMHYFFIPMYYLTGGPVNKALELAFDKIRVHGDFPQIYDVLVGFTANISQELARPSLWVGLAAAIALFYAAGEIRRRRSF